MALCIRHGIFNLRGHELVICCFIKWHNEQITPVVSGQSDNVFIILTESLVPPDSKEPDENNEKSSGKTNYTLLNQPHHRKRIPKVKYTVIY